MTVTDIRTEVRGNRDGRDCLERGMRELSCTMGMF